MGKQAHATSKDTPASASALAPATGSQLWRLNDLQLLGEALQASNGDFVTRGAASALIEQAKKDGRF